MHKHKAFPLNESAAVNFFFSFASMESPVRVEWQQPKEQEMAKC